MDDRASKSVAANCSNLAFKSQRHLTHQALKPHNLVKICISLATKSLNIMNVFRLYFNYAGYITCVCTNVVMCIVVIIVFFITANLHNPKCRRHNITLHEHALTHIIVIDDNYICDIGVCCFCHSPCTFASIQTNCK